MKEKIIEFVKKRWIIMTACILALAAGITVIIVSINGSFEKKPEPVNANVEEKVIPETKDVFWNVNYEKYKTQENTPTARKADKDTGYYIVQFSNLSGQGRLVKRRILDESVINKVDSNQVMGLVLNENGIVSDVVTAEERGLTLGETKVYITAVAKDGETYTVNTSPFADGESSEIKIGKKVPVYDIGGITYAAGAKMGGSLAVGDCISVVKNMQGSTVCVALTDRTAVSGVYYNIDRQWDAKAKKSLRKPDSKGVYTIRLMTDGKAKEFKTESLSIVNNIDSVLICNIEAEGNTIKTFNKLAVVLKSSKAVTGNTVDAVNGNEVTITKSGKSQTIKLPNKVNIYDVTDKNAADFNAAEIKEGDTVTVVTNNAGSVTFVYITAHK